MTLELGSALPVKVGVESFELEVFNNELGASGAVVSFELDGSECLPAGNADFPANVSIGINNMKPKVDSISDL